MVLLEIGGLEMELFKDFEQLKPGLGILVLLEPVRRGAQRSSYLKDSERIFDLGWAYFAGARGKGDQIARIV